MKNNLVKLPVKYRKRKVKDVPIREKIIEFPPQSFTPVGNDEKYVSAEVGDEFWKDLGFNKGDELIINTYEAVGNGQIIMIEQDEQFNFGIAKFIGGGEVRLDYIHSMQTFELSEIKIIGRVVKSIKSWE